MDEDDWIVVSKVRRSKYRRQVLTYLNEAGDPRPPKEISERTGIRRNHVSRALTELQEDTLVELITPDAPYDRLYRITDRGKMIMEKIQEINNE